VAELRIFPRESAKPAGFASLWNAEVLGVNALGVPRGGIPGTLLRRQLKVSDFERDAREVFDVIGRVTRIVELRDHPAIEILTRVKNARFTEPKAPSGGSGRGRPSLSAEYYAQLARGYADLSMCGRPIQALAEKRGLDAQRFWPLSVSTTI
jgi:hypothetical protein